ncbi:DUF5134 domain-containing protein [Streptacidiphilus sp. 4-A2]|nr:DUF5134 domain-containing protein [Streptacidiphilus sp. 4-A2]
MNIPHWLADIFAAIMLATAAYCVGRLVFARLRGRHVDHDTDLVHVLMGVGMAGMLVSDLNPLDGTVWKAVFAVTTLWFAGRVALGRHGDDRARLALRHHVPHLVLSGAMLYMYLAPSGARAGSASGGGMGDAMGGSASMVVHYPILALVLALFLCGYAVIVIDRTPLVAASGGTPDARGTAPAAPLGACCAVAGAGDTEALPSASGAGQDGGRGQGRGQNPVRSLLAPRAANCCDIAMSVTMAFMLITLLQ